MERSQALFEIAVQQRNNIVLNGLNETLQVAADLLVANAKIEELEAKVEELTPDEDAEEDEQQ